MFSIICDIVACFINQKKYFQVAKATKKPVSLGDGEGDLITGQLYPYCQRWNSETVWLLAVTFYMVLDAKTSLDKSLCRKDMTLNTKLPQKADLDCLLQAVSYRNMRIFNHTRKQAYMP